MIKGRRLALLLGVAEYEDPGIRPLPFVLDDQAQLAISLEAAGYKIVPTDSAGRLGRTSIKVAIQRFLNQAARGDTLIIFLSGHGAHTDGFDYLVPSDALTTLEPFAEGCVRIALASEIERSAARRVLVLVDACREGFDDKTMGLQTAVRWGKGKLELVSNQEIGYVFACRPGEVARIIETPEGHFSLFARAIGDIVADAGRPESLEAFEERLHGRMAELAELYPGRAQHARVLCESPRASFVIFPEVGRTRHAAGSHWVRLVRDSPVWERVAHLAGMEAVRAAACAVTESAASSWRVAAERTSDDPWQEPEFAQRMLDRVEYLLTRILVDMKVSAAEVALLVTVPFLQAAHWASEAAAAVDLEPTRLDTSAATPERAKLERFYQGFPRLRRRAMHNHGSRLGSDAVSWWMFLRWLGQRPAVHDPERLAPVLRSAVDAGRAAAAVFEPRRVAELVRALRADVRFLTRSDRGGALADRVVMGANTAAEQEIRERLIGHVLVVAHALAINLQTLPAVIVDHIAITDSVDLDELRQTLAMAVWEPRGSARVLHAACRHPAVEVALREHAAALNETLEVIQDLAASELVLGPLAELPVHATAERVQAAELDAGRRAYRSAGVRFRLDEDRVQELLMGEELYGDPALAVREMYQNALDACRFRGAREAYIDRTSEGRRESARDGPWSGRIEFAQCSDAGGQYLECRDNGIGMGLRELSDVFSQAGTRFADLPEFLEEQVEWERYGIRIYPNSRFGIGVLSYFMLADEISVDTCRLSRKGLPGTKLRVTIAGPGNLFRIQELGPGDVAGTTVRLRLRADQAKPVSALTIVRGAVWFPEFDTEVVEGEEKIELNHGELSTCAPIGSRDPLGRSYREMNTRVEATRVPGVWWCAGSGGLLADGLWAGKPSPGAIVNLGNELMPRLSVDRSKIVRYASDSVSTLLEEAAIDLVSPGARDLVTLEWLDALGAEDPRAADAVWMARMASAIPALTIAGDLGNEIRGDATGAFLGDSNCLRVLVRGEPGYYLPSGEPWNTPDVVAWRLEAWRADGVDVGDLVADSVATEQIVPARPADIVLLRGRGGTPRGVLDARLRLNWTAQQVVARMVELGVIRGEREQAVAERVACLPEFDAIAPALVSFRPAGSLNLGEVLAAARTAGVPPAALAARLNGAGLRVDPLPGSARDQVGDSDLVLASADLSGAPTLNYRGASGWLAADAITTAHILRGSVKLRMPVGAVIEQLCELGFVVPADARELDPGLQVDEPALIALSRDRDGEAPWRDDLALPLADLVRVSVAMEAESVGASAAYVRSLGLSAEPGPLSEARIAADDLPLVLEAVGSRDLRIPVVRLHRQSRLRDLPVPELIARLRHYGLTAPDPGAIARVPADEWDLRLLTRDLDGKDHWLTRDDASVMRVLRAAHALGTSVDEIRTRLTEMGLIPTTSRGDVTIVSQADIAILDAVSADRRLIAIADDVTPAWLVRHGDERLGGERATAALRRLGFSVPSLDDLNEQDRQLLAEFSGEPAPDTPDIYAIAMRDGVSPQAAAERLKVLGFAVPPPKALADSVCEEDLVLLSADLDGKAPWVPDGRFGPAHVALAAHTTGRSCAEVRERLSELGYRSGACPVDGRVTLTARDKLLLEDVRALKADARISSVSVLSLAARRDVAPAEVRDRLLAFGYLVTPGPLPLEPLSASDRDLIDRLPRSSIADRVGPGAILRLAHDLGMSPRELAGRLGALGLSDVSPERLPLRLDADDLGLIRIVPRECAGWLEEPLQALALRVGGRDWLMAARRISALDVVAVAARCDVKPVELASRIGGLGLAVPPRHLVEDFSVDLAGVVSQIMAEQQRYGFHMERDQGFTAVEVLRVADELKLEPLRLARNLRAWGLLVDVPERIIGRVSSDG